MDMNDQTPKSFYRYSASVSVKFGKHYYWSKKEDFPFVFGNEEDSSLTCWRDSETADVNCNYVFGIKASASDKRYRFIVPDSNSENLHWSDPKELPFKTVFSLKDDRIFFREKVEQDQKWKFKHVKSEKYAHIKGNKIVLTSSKEIALETAVTAQ